MFTSIKDLKDRSEKWVSSLQFHISFSTSLVLNYMQLTFVNMVIFMDLYLVMINPFFPRLSRIKFYLCGLIILTVVSLSIVYNFPFKPHIHRKPL